MSLNYGYTEQKISEPLKIYQQNWQQLRTYKQLRYSLTYSSVVSTGKVFPVELNSGYPQPLLYAGNFDEDTKITLLGHTFDFDSEIVVLDLKYILLLVFKDGTIAESLLKKIELEHKKVPKIIFANQYFVLNESFLLKDITPNIKNLACFNVLIQRTSSFAHGNESCLDVLVEY